MKWVGLTSSGSRARDNAQCRAPTLKGIIFIAANIVYIKPVKCRKKPAFKNDNFVGKPVGTCLMSVKITVYYAILYPHSV